ncbi:MAG TPA: TIGR03960 family B12-binding radical SAM protein [Chloroflexi bacterium]|nr:TIGR03960 family B12-binding radical SAM protein [Chloroflexota bacterium]
MLAIFTNEQFMIDSDQITKKLRKILPTVTVPGRYTGGEYNQIRKNWDEVELRVGLIFPEIYDLGMSNLGLMVLYDLINRSPRYLAERAFVPWIDMEDAMRTAGLPLYSLESKRPLIDFDVLAFSLPYESLYTNFLNALDLSEVPLYSSDRDDSHPLVIAGGHSTFNPEPIAPFLDAVVIGEGEEIILEILDTLAGLPDRARKSRKLNSLSALGGVYIPAFYQPNYRADGTFSHLRRNNTAAPEIILKRIIGKLPPPPLNPIVPYVDTVHNRAPLEIMRGCTRGCRFCHAGIVTRPVRERSKEEILAAMEALIPNTGYSEIGLLSLSSSDYTQIIPLIKAINERFSGQNINISLPSLRIESVSVDLMDALAGKRRSGFTLAPEAATERLRAIINKPISDQQLLDTAREIYSRGWHTIKLYFMIGHPSETQEDVQAIADLSKRVLAVGKEESGNKAKVHTSVSTFVPKPHTPFQWVGVASRDDIQDKIDLLQNEVRGKGLKLNWNAPKETHFEAWLSRGDRRLSTVIYHAWANGARFDAWQEHFDFDTWLQAFDEAGLDPDFYSTRERAEDEDFPWDHINIGVKKSFLLQDYHLSQEGKTRPDCRDECFACGILPAYNALRHEYPGELWLCPEVSRLIKKS